MSNEVRNSTDASAHTTSELGQVCVLIDSILPFEACLYYQVLPLSIEGSRLTVGIVDPADRSASDYVKKQLSYINYSIAFEEISSDWHRGVLSRYLSQTTSQSSASATTPSSLAQSQTAVPESEDSSAHPEIIHPEATAPELTEPNVVEPVEPSPAQSATPAQILDDCSTKQTFILDSTDILDSTEEDIAIEVRGDVSDTSHTAAHSDTPQAGFSPSRLPTTPQPTHAPPKAEDIAEKKTDFLTAGDSSPTIGKAPLTLEIDPRYRTISATRLSLLPPNLLMQALLCKVLDEGIGRLYFERRKDTGRILWSRDGILQAVVETVEPKVFQGVINEFKLLTHLSLISVQKVKQVEIERLYEGQRILLRFRLIPSGNGEEATLQILRGAALRFHQQQQIDKLGRDALGTAQTLKKRLDEIRDRARQSLNFEQTRSETLPVLMQLLKQMEAQVVEMIAAYDRADQHDAHLEEAHTVDSPG